ncbi:MAG: leucine-rich repeat domain-containing protein [Candidatus Thorarchaeota archaeon]
MSRKEIKLTVRCSKLARKNGQFIFRTPADTGSTFQERTSNLEWTKQIVRPVRIDMSSNWLTKVNLTPIASCADLDYLSIAGNALKSIDLSPLESCNSLRILDLSHNLLEDIDLTPLSMCESLTYLYLQENMFEKVNIAPLLQLKKLKIAVIQLTHRGKRPKLVVDSLMSSKPPNLNDVLYANVIERKNGFMPDWLYDKNTAVEYEPRTYRELVDEFGWATVKKHLKAICKSIHIGFDFDAQQILLHALGMPELACYDGNLRDIIKLLPLSGSYEEGVLSLRAGMVTLLENQLDRGGSTLYFDVDLLATTPGSVLIPSLLNRRDKEMQNVTLFDRTGTVDLLPLWATSYGSKILKALGFGRRISTSRLSDIQKALKKINHDFSVERVVYDVRKNKKDQYHLGDVILSHVCNGLS